MSITDELREYAHDCCARIDDDIHAIADRIDAEHDKALNSVDGAYDSGYNVGYDEGFASVDDWLAQHEDAMAEHGWYRALDADKKPIHLGDEVYQVEGSWVYTVKSITFYPENTTVSFECKHGFGCDSVHNVRHYHAPTVEDVLREFICDHEEGVRDEVELIAEYAAKLRLAEEDA